MDLRNIRIEDIRKKKITIGKVAENLRTCIGFDCTEIFAEYPDAVPALTVISPKGVSYPAIVQRSGNSVLWEIRDSDLTAAGTGEIQLSFIQGEVIAKSYTGQIEVIRSIPSTGEAPEPITEWETEANAKLAEVAQALEDIPEAIDAALETAKESGEFDGPPGKDGKDGAPGQDGADGAPGKDGKDGQDGAPGRDGEDGTDGQDGVSPTVTVTDITGGHRVTITDKDHPQGQTFDVMDGQVPSEPPYELIREITLAERTSLDITTDSYGEQLRLRSVFMEIYFPANLTTESSGYGRYYFYDANDKAVLCETGRFITNTSAQFKEISIDRKANKVTGYYTRLATTGGQGALVVKNFVNVNNNISSGTRFDMGDIVRIVMNSADYEPEGTIIKIYGQREN